MKAMILAAGKSTRLGPLGQVLPKPMLSLGGRPVLEWTLLQLAQSGVSDIVINLHHAPDVIPEHFGDGAAWGLRITYTFETDLLGTAGGLRNARKQFDDEPFLVIYGDTVLDWDPVPAIADHYSRRPMATIVVAEVEDPSRFGVVVLDDQWRIRRFVEKPGPRPELGRWVNAGLCVLEPSIFEHIPESRFSDLGQDVFPTLLERGLSLRAYPRPRPLIAIDTPELFQQAQHTWIASR
jgi:mannose-1-phosphate guanylyltransferase